MHFRKQKSRDVTCHATTQHTRHAFTTSKRHDASVALTLGLPAGI